MADGARSSNIAVKQSSLIKNSQQDGSSVKMLINEMCDGENTKLDESNVVARLMGMNSFPSRTEPTINAMECFDENSRQNTQKMSHFVSAKIEWSSFSSTLENSPLNCKQQYSIPSTTKSYRREHPQEEQLQKFKKEFEAWQESKLSEFSSNLGHYSREELKNEQILALENLKKEKMAGYINARLTQKKPVNTDDYVSVENINFARNDLHDFQHNGSFLKQLMPKTEDDMAVRRELEASSFEPASSAKFQDKKSPPYSPTRIVILKPNSDVNDPSCGSAKVVEKGSSTEDFLEEVKRRLRLEIESKGRDNSIRRLSLSHTSLRESLANPKQLAQEPAKHGAMLRRSQSMTTYSNAFHFDGQESSKSIKRETRNFISRLKNVLKDDTEMKSMLEDGMAGKSLSAEEKVRSKSIADFFKEGKDASFWEDKKAVNESIPKHLRLEQLKMVPLDDEAMSPSNLDISFSASPSGSAFNKDLLEEALNFQKHEASKNDSATVIKRKKDGFSIKSTVSNLRRNLGLKTKFFGRQVSSMVESTVETVHYVKPDDTTPSIIRNFDIVKDNSTEVPPSPASFPCSPLNDHHSPVSPLEDLFVDDNSSTQVSGEISTTLTDFGNQTEHFEGKRCGMAMQTKLYDCGETIPIEGCGEAYVSDILVASGLYRPCWALDQTISQLDGQIKPISPSVFYEVEEKCRKLRNVDDDYSTVRLRKIDIDRKILFDLVNEALPSALNAPMIELILKRSTRSPTESLHGRNLLDELLNQIHMYANPEVDRPQSIDMMVYWDLKLRPWLTESHEDISSLGREVEWEIISELIDDLLSDFFV